MNKNLIIFLAVLLMIVVWLLNVFVLPGYIVTDEFQLFLTICVFYTLLKFGEWLKNNFSGKSGNWKGKFKSDIFD